MDVLVIQDPVQHETLEKMFLEKTKTPECVVVYLRHEEDVKHCCTFITNIQKSTRNPSHMIMMLQNTPFFEQHKLRIIQPLLSLLTETTMIVAVEDKQYDGIALKSVSGFLLNQLFQAFIEIYTSPIKEDRITIRHIVIEGLQKLKQIMHPNHRLLMLFKFILLHNMNMLAVHLNNQKKWAAINISSIELEESLAALLWGTVAFLETKRFIKHEIKQLVEESLKHLSMEEIQTETQELEKKMIEATEISKDTPGYILKNTFGNVIYAQILSNVNGPIWILPPQSSLFDCLQKNRLSPTPHAPLKEVKEDVFVITPNKILNGSRGIKNQYLKTVHEKTIIHDERHITEQNGPGKSPRVHELVESSDLSYVFDKQKIVSAVQHNKDQIITPRYGITFNDYTTNYSCVGDVQELIGTHIKGEITQECFFLGKHSHGASWLTANMVDTRLRSNRYCFHYYPEKKIASNVDVVYQRISNIPPIVFINRAFENSLGDEIQTMVFELLEKNYREQPSCFESVILGDELTPKYGIRYRKKTAPHTLYQKSMVETSIFFLPENKSLGIGKQRNVSVIFDIRDSKYAQKITPQHLDHYLISQENNYISVQGTLYSRQTKRRAILVLPQECMGDLMHVYDGTQQHPLAKVFISIAGHVLHRSENPISTTNEFFTSSRTKRILNNLTIEHQKLDHINMYTQYVKINKIETIDSFVTRFICALRIDVGNFVHPYRQSGALINIYDKFKIDDALAQSLPRLFLSQRGFGNT